MSPSETVERSYRRVQRRGQSGASLIEVLIATAVMVPLILAASAGVMTTISVSRGAQAAQERQVALTTTTENLKAMPYLDCGTAKEYQSLATEWTTEQRTEAEEEPVRPVGTTVSAVRYWDPDAAEYVDDCASDGGAQQLTVTAISQGRTQTANIVKRNPDASPVLELRR